MGNTVSYNRGIMGLRGYTNGGPTGDPWPISGTPTEWTPEKIRKLNEAWSAMLDAQERRSDIRGEHVALVDSLQSIIQQLRRGDSWHPSTDEVSPGVDIEYGSTDIPRHVVGRYSPWMDEIEFEGDTILGEKYPHRSVTLHEFGHAADPEVTGWGTSSRPFLDFLDDIWNETSEYPQRDTILAESFGVPQIFDQSRSQDIQPPQIYAEREFFTNAFGEAFDFLQSPESRATGAVVPERYKTIVRELLRLPLYQAHPLRLREGLRR